ncbi:SGNH/GDSL hydrolase family protein [Mycobacterium sp. 21AC1]|uniref:SGNH/GDSL hydrolase family protein n=1 Tax=[Mycobacterium] appelbergii TaxID=2939269 RepID=UPI0029390F0A|nr:SGNH/GDSL hydrolase family protein [Mycobacterium sp. 21AC1]MDV3128673.1 SGNH/GDSL hydrolase family protein [Mycobacterium sp. 21AC1]
MQYEAARMKDWVASRMSTFGTIALSLLLIAATATTTAAVTDRTRPSLPPPDDGPVRVSVIGDSYSVGTNNQVVWPILIAAGSPLSISIAAARDASYAGGAGQSGRFAEQIDRALASKPSVIVVFGGLGDVGEPDAQITQSAIDLFAELIRRAPTTKLVIIGPIWHTQPVPDVFITLDIDIERAARVTHTTYISLIHKDWLVADGLMQGDSAPTDDGQSVLARELNPILLDQIRNPRKSVLP